MQKYNHVILTNADEAVFSAEITKIFPATSFVDSNIWETTTPPEKDSIADCKSGIIYLWNKEIYRSLPFIQRNDGKFEGPQVGMVIMFIRSRFENESILLSGEIKAGVTIERPEVPKMLDFVRKIWKILKKVAPKRAAEIHPNTKWVGEVDKHIFVGNDADQWCRAKEERFFKYNNTPNYYLRTS